MISEPLAAARERFKTGEEKAKHGGPDTRTQRREKRLADLRTKIAAAGPAPHVEAVRPLNPGFFMLERMRTNLGAKKREQKRKELK